MVNRYRATFKGADPDTNSKHSILLVSVGQQYHEGAKLLATVDLINRSNFEKCTIMLADTLQRYNYMDTLTQQEAYNYALSLGNEWIDRNTSILNNLSIPFGIIRWDTNYQNKSCYQNYRNKLINDYHKEDNIKLAIDKTINSYLNRKDITDSSFKKYFDNCFNYIIEECPIIMPLWAYQGFDYIIYPKPMTPAMHITYEKFVLPKYPQKSVWLTLRFRRMTS